MNEKLKVYLIKINYKIQKNTLKEFLNISIVNHCMKYKLCRKQYDSLYAFYMLRKIYLNEFNIDINNFKLKENEYGKPYFDNLYFNISNSMNYIAIAISKKEVGIDIEFLFNIKEKKEYERFILTKKELSEFSFLEDKRKYLLTKWCQKESYFKFKGTGIDFQSLKINIKKKGLFKYLNLNNDLACIYIYCKYNLNDFVIDLNYN